jgi:DNA-binding GntR family transcriptional regulator
MRQKKTTPSAPDFDPPSKLQRDLLPRILEVIRQDALHPGQRLPEAAFARRLQVSRTPVRAALRHLAERGVIAALPNGGYALSRPTEEIAESDYASASADLDAYCVRIARDRVAGALPSQASEADMMRRYDIGRPLLLRILNKLAEVGLVERRPGHGWHFSPLNDDAAIIESYAFRRIIEPAALLEATFAPEPAWLAEMRARHEAMLARPWSETASIALFEMNCEFHEGLIAASGNRYLLLALQQQSRLRRYSNYSWRYGPERVAVSCREHLEIIARLEAGEREIAAALLRRHLDRAREVSLSPRASSS